MNSNAAQRSVIPVQTWVASLAVLFESRAWVDQDGAALALARRATQDGQLGRSAIRAEVPRSFLARNRLSLDTLTTAVESEFASWDASPGNVLAGNVRILVVAASPEGLAEIGLDRELRLIREELEKAPIERRFTVDARLAAPRAELARYLLEGRPEILHFAGHGSTAGVAFESASGTAELVSGGALRQLLAVRNIAERLQLVVLNSCYSEAQAQAVVQTVPAVIGMKSSVDDVSAVEFARSLYMALGQGLTVGEAHEVALAAVRLAGGSGSHMPILLTKEPAIASTLAFFGRTPVS